MTDPIVTIFALIGVYHVGKWFAYQFLRFGERDTELDCSGTTGNGTVENIPLEEYGYWGAGGSPSSEDDFAYCRDKLIMEKGQLLEAW